MLQKFGEIALDMGFINSEQLVECLDFQKKWDAKGRPHRMLGIIMATKGYLHTNQVSTILKQQEQMKTIYSSEPPLAASMLDAEKGKEEIFHTTKEVPNLEHAPNTEIKNADIVLDDLFINVPSLEHASNIEINVPSLENIPNTEIKNADIVPENLFVNMPSLDHVPNAEIKNAGVVPENLFVNMPSLDHVPNAEIKNAGVVPEMPDSDLFDQVPSLNHVPNAEIKNAGIVPEMPDSDLFDQVPSLDHVPNAEIKNAGIVPEMPDSDLFDQVPSLDHVPNAEIKNADIVPEIPDSDLFDQVPSLEHVPNAEIKNADIVPEMPDSDLFDQVPSLEHVPNAEIKNADIVPEMPDSDLFDEIPNLEYASNAEIKNAGIVPEMPDSDLFDEVTSPMNISAEALHAIPSDETLHAIPSDETLHEIPSDETLHTIPNAEALHVIPNAEALHSIPNAEALHVTPNDETLHIIPNAEALNVIPNAEALNVFEEVISPTNINMKTEAIEMIPNAEVLDNVLFNQDVVQGFNIGEMSPDEFFDLPKNEAIPAQNDENIVLENIFETDFLDGVGLENDKVGEFPSEDVFQKHSIDSWNDNIPSEIKLDAVYSDIFDGTPYKDLDNTTYSTIDDSGQEYALDNFSQSKQGDNPFETFGFSPIGEAWDLDTPSSKKMDPILPISSIDAEITRPLQTPQPSSISSTDNVPTYTGNNRVSNVLQQIEDMSLALKQNAIQNEEKAPVKRPHVKKRSRYLEKAKMSRKASTRQIATKKNNIWLYIGTHFVLVCIFIGILFIIHQTSSPQIIQTQQENTQGITPPSNNIEKQIQNEAEIIKQQLEENYALAHRSIEKNNFRDADIFIKNVISQDENYKDIRFFQAKCACHDGYYNSALTLLKNYTPSPEMVHQVALLTAQCYEKNNNWDDAHQQYDSIPESAVEYKTAMIGKAKLYLAQEEFLKALDFIYRARKIESAIGSLELTEIQTQAIKKLKNDFNNNREKALNDIQEYIKIDKDYVFYYQIRAQNTWDQDPKSAFEDIQYVMKYYQPDKPSSVSRNDQLLLERDLILNIELYLYLLVKVKSSNTREEAKKYLQGNRKYLSHMALYAMYKTSKNKRVKETYANLLYKVFQAREAYLSANQETNELFMADWMKDAMDDVKKNVGTKILQRDIPAKYIKKVIDIKIYFMNLQQQANFQQGDIIVGINNQPIYCFEEILTKAPQGNTKLSIQRRDNTMDIDITTDININFLYVIDIKGN
ncbi:MAG: hypothetical protein KBC30_07455 [Planctomycetes bacterium]|nr:hypothetical protein [Planctomycetota bacterium]